MEFAPPTHGGMVEEDERENALGYRQRAPEAKLPPLGNFARMFGSESEKGPLEKDGRRR